MRSRTLSIVIGTTLTVVGLFSAASASATEATPIGTTVDSCASGYNGVVVGTGVTGPVDLCENLVVTGTGGCPAGDQGVIVDGRYVCFG